MNYTLYLQKRESDPESHKAVYMHREDIIQMNKKMFDENWIDVAEFDIEQLEDMDKAYEEVEKRNLGETEVLINRGAILVDERGDGIMVHDPNYWKPIHFVE